MQQFSLTELCLDPFVKLRDFFGSLPIGLKFLRGLPYDQRMAKGGALLDSNRRDCETMHGYPRAGISQQTGSSWWYSIQHNKGRLASKLHDLGGHADGSQIEDTGAAWDQEALSGCQ